MSTPTSSPQREKLSCYLPASHLIHEQVEQALREDLGTGDLTAALLPGEQMARAELITREEAVLCGQIWFDQVFAQVDPEIQIHWSVCDGEFIEPGQRLCLLEGRSRALLTGERTAMNYLQTLSGTATRTREFVEQVAGLPVQLLDTRKTLPGLRVQQKYAVCCGRAYNHRLGLFDAILIKENHILAAGSIAAALEAARRLDCNVEIMIEVESLDELNQALDAGAELVMLDNFSLEQMREAVALNAGRARLEASGGISLETVRAIADTGVDRISIGALTKDVRAVDLSMRFLDDA